MMMGYTTEFEGEFKLDKPLGPDMIAWLKNANEGDLWPRPRECAGYCQWIPNEDGTAIRWDGQEKFRSYMEWLRLVVGHLHASGYRMHGAVSWQGDGAYDSGVIYVGDQSVVAVQDEWERVRPPAPEWFEEQDHDDDDGDDIPREVSPGAEAVARYIMAQCPSYGVAQGADLVYGTEHAVSELRRLSGLTWEHLSQLFEVSRRSIHFWASGKPMTAAHTRRLMEVLAVVRDADRGDAMSNRVALFEPTNGVVPFDLLAQQRFAEARMLLGPGPGRRDIAKTALDDHATSLRRPPPPEELVGAYDSDSTGRDIDPDIAEMLENEEHFGWRR